MAKIRLAQTNGQCRVNVLGLNSADAVAPSFAKTLLPKPPNNLIDPARSGAMDVKPILILTEARADKSNCTPISKLASLVIPPPPLLEVVVHFKLAALLMSKNVNVTGGCRYMETAKNTKCEYRF